MRYPIVPMAKPRMTQRDQWGTNKRPIVARYHAFKDECRLRKVTVPEAGAHIKFVISMPKSWTEKKREEQNGMPHQSRPDCDNLLKALLDAVLKEDSHIWDIRVTKIWGYSGEIEVVDSDRPRGTS